MMVTISRQVVKVLLDKGVSPDSVNNARSTALHLASAAGHTTVVQVKGRNARARTHASNRCSCPMGAGRDKGRIGLCQFSAQRQMRAQTRARSLTQCFLSGRRRQALVKAGARLDLRNAASATALHLAAQVCVYARGRMGI